MQFSKLFCCKYLYVELYRGIWDYRTGFKIELDKYILRCSMSVLGVTLIICIGTEAYSS